MASKYLVLISFILFFIHDGNTELCNPCKDKAEISTENAPAAIGPYSQAILAGNYLFVSGQIGMTPDGIINDETAGGQTRQALTNAGNILQEANLDFSHVVRAMVLMKDINDYDEINEVYKDFFPDPAPARAAFQVAALPKDAKVEIEVTAVVN